MGKIYKLNKEIILLRIQTKKELQVIIEHFDKYPLLTGKWRDYVYFKQAYDIVEKQEHLTEQGLHKIISIKAALRQIEVFQIN